MPSNYYDLLDNLDRLETRCDIYEECIKSEQSILRLSELFRLSGDSEFADYLLHRFYMLHDQYENDCSLIKIYENQIKH